MTNLLSRNGKKCMSILLAFAMVVCMFSTSNMTEAAKKTKVAKKSISVTVKKKQTIKISNKKKGAKYTFKSSNKKVAKVTNKGVVTGVKKGSTTVKVYEKKKKSKKANKLATVKVKVIAATSQTTAPTTTVAPTTEPTVEPTQTPTSKKFTLTEEEYNAVLDKSLYATGNNARIKKAIEKAKNGDEVSIAYIGGSITEGARVDSNTECYAVKSANDFKTKYAKGDNVTFINAGMSGSPSTLGVVRYERDILNRLPQGEETPDILVIEFAVNDYNEVTKGEAYESMIRRALEKGSAVILMFSVFESGNVMQSDYVNYGKLYDIPMISMSNAVKDYFGGSKFTRWYFSDDGLHPTANGYQLMSDCISKLFATIDSEEAETDNITDISAITPRKGESYKDMKFIDSATDISKINAIESIDKGGFSEVNKTGYSFQYTYNGLENQLWFPNNWTHANGTDSMKLTTNCKSLLMGYKLSSGEGYGKAEVYVDGTLVNTVDGGSSSGCANASVVFNDKTATKHNVEIKMASNSTAKGFCIYSFGYVE